MKHILIVAALLLINLISYAQEPTLEEVRKKALNLALETKSEIPMYEDEADLSSTAPYEVAHHQRDEVVKPQKQYAKSTTNQHAKVSKKSDKSIPKLPAIETVKFKQVRSRYANRLQLPIKIKSVPKAVYSSDIFSFDAISIAHLESDQIQKRNPVAKPKSKKAVARIESFNKLSTQSLSAVKSSQSIAKLPIRIKDIPRTKYRHDQEFLGESIAMEKSQESSTREAQIENKRIETTVATKATKSQKRNKVSRISQLNTLASNQLNTQVQSISNIQTAFPIKIKEVPRAVYYADQIEAALIAEAQSRNEKQLKKVAIKASKQEVKYNNTIATALPTAAFDRREIKSIIKRVKKNEGNISAPINFETKEKPVTAATAPAVETKTTMTATKIAIFREPELIEELPTKKSTVQVKKPIPVPTKNEVANRELAILEKMMASKNTTKTTTKTVAKPVTKPASTATTTNPNIPVTTQPLEVTSQIINGRSVITEIKPVNETLSTSTTSTSTIISSTTSTTSTSVATAPAAHPQTHAPIPTYKTTAVRRSQRAFKFSQNSITGENISIDNMKGKVIVMNFWFTTCKECIREMPDLNELKARYQGQDVEFVSICLSSKSEIEKFVKKHPFNYKHIANARTIAHEYYMFIYPGHIVVDRDGGLMNMLTGNGPEIMNQLELTIQQGLTEVF